MYTYTTTQKNTEDVPGKLPHSLANTSLSKQVIKHCTKAEKPSNIMYCVMYPLLIVIPLLRITGKFRVLSAHLRVIKLIFWRRLIYKIAKQQHLLTRIVNTTPVSFHWLDVFPNQNICIFQSSATCTTDTCAYFWLLLFLYEKNGGSLVISLIYI